MLDPCHRSWSWLWMKCYPWSLQTRGQAEDPGGGGLQPDDLHWPHYPPDPDQVTTAHITRCWPPVPQVPFLSSSHHGPEPDLHWLRRGSRGHLWSAHRGDCQGELFPNITPELSRIMKATRLRMRIRLSYVLRTLKSIILQWTLMTVLR